MIYNNGRMEKTMRVMAKRKIFYIVGIVLYIMSFIGIVLSPGLTFLSYLKTSRHIFLISLGLSIIAIAFLGGAWADIGESVKLQMKIIYSLILLVLIPFFIRKKCVEYQVLYKHSNFIFGCIVVGFLFWVGYPFIRKEKHNWNFKEKVKNNWYLGLILLVIIGLSIEQIYLNIKGDAILYYRELVSSWENFTLNPNDITMFKYCGHLSFAFAFFASIGENILPYFFKGAIIENIILWCICILFFYKLLKLIKPDISNTTRLLGTVLFGLTPTIFGNLHDVTLEMYVMVFWILFLWAAFSSYHVLEMFFSLCLFFTKENALVLVAGYYLGCLIWRFVLFFKNKKEPFSNGFIIESLSIYIPTVIWIFYYSLTGEWNGNGSSGVNTFDICIDFIVHKIKQLYILNFSWSFIIFILEGLFFGFFVNKTMKYIGSKSVGIICSYIMFILAQFIFVTYSLPRYIYVNYFFIALALTVFVANIKRISNVIMLFCIGLNLVQNYKNIDLLSLCAFDTINIGSERIVFDSPFYLSGEGLVFDDGDTLKLYGDGMYNRQASYMDGLISETLKYIKYDENTLILLPDCFKPLSDHFYFGQLSQYYYYDDCDEVVKVVIDENKYHYDLVKLNIEYTDGKDDYKKYLSSYDKVYYFSFAFSENVNDIIENAPAIGLEKTFAYKGWTVNLYEVNDEH